MARQHVLRERAARPGWLAISAWGRSDATWIFLFLLPFLTLYLGFTLWPLVATIYYSLFDWDGIRSLDQFIGLANYQTILGDPLFWRSVWNTLLFAAANTAIKLPITFIAAVLLTREWFWFKRFFRTVFFVPLTLPVALAGLVFTYLLNPSNGALNAFLTGAHLIRRPVDLLGHTTTALLTVILISVWQIFGQYMIYWMAALQNVPEELYESAEIDGAGAWRKHIHITLPIIRPVAVIIALLALVNALHVFGIVVTLTQGGPGYSTYVVSYFIYAEAFRSVPFRFGYASAAALLFALLAFVFVAARGVFTARAKGLREEYGV